MTNAELLQFYRRVNQARKGCFVYNVGDRGFFAEVTTVTRAMIYAWSEGLQLVLDSSEFAYRVRHGWADYFQPFCNEATAVAPERIREWIRFTRQGDRAPFQKLRSFDPRHLRFGSLEINGLQLMIRHFMRMIFHLSDESWEQVNRLRRSLDLPENYVVVHIRRGDKVGDEDIFYPVELYFDQLGPLGDEAVFVMSDDYRAVVEVREHLQSCGLGNRVATLCRQEHTGFDIWKLRAGGSFAGEDRNFEGEDAYRRYVFEGSNRLLAETVIAVGSTRFASTWGSSVGKTVWYLHDKPEMCHLLDRRHLQG